MASDDLKSHALNPSQDFYALLDLQRSASDSEIRRAYRKTALKYHPDKVGANQEALDKFHLLSIANEVLSDPGVRQLYDNARRATEERKQRESAYEGRRKWMKEDLERREGGALKRKREEVVAEEEFERELRRIAEDGRRRRREREEVLRREARGEEEEGRKGREGDLDGAAAVADQGNGLKAAASGPSDLDRSVTLRYPADAASQLDRDSLIRLWERFGPIEDCVLREKKLKRDGEKHRQAYMTAVLVYKSIVGAHAAVSDIPKLRSTDPGTWAIFDAVGWAGGKEPDCIPKAQQPGMPSQRPRGGDAGLEGGMDTPRTPQTNRDAGVGLKKAPSFASFKATPSGGTPKGVSSPSLDDNTMIRLKNAERRRLEEKIRREEAAATAAASPQD